MKIRLAKDTDIFQIYDLWERLLEEEAGTLVSRGPYPDVDVEHKDTMKRFAQDFSAVVKSEGSCIIVAEEEGKIIAYVKANVAERAMGDPRYYLFVQEAYTKPEYRKQPRVISALDRALDTWTDKWEEKNDIELNTRELVAISSPTQLDRWRRKGWNPYAIMFWRER